MAVAYCVPATASSDGCYSSVSISTRINADAEAFTEYSVGLRTASAPLTPIGAQFHSCRLPYKRHCNRMIPTAGERMSGPAQSCSCIVNLLQSGI